MAKRKTERLGAPRRYTFKLYPSAKQNETLFAQAQMMAELWNGLLHRNEEQYRRTRGQQGVMHAEGKRLLSYEDMTAEITGLRHACPDWAALSVGSARRVANALSDAFQAFFRRMKELGEPGGYETRAADWRSKKRGNPRWSERNPTRHELAGYPKYRRIAQADWLPHCFQSGCKLAADGGRRQRPNGRASDCKWRLALKGIDGSIRARGEFPEQALAWSDADLRHADGHWWLSVGVESLSSRDASGDAVTVRMDLIDTFAAVDGADVGPPDFTAVHAAQDRVDVLKSERDQRWPWPAGKPRPNSRAYREMTRRITRLEAHTTRRRRELLHEWTTAVIAQSGRINVIKPPIRDATRSARGNAKDWGGAVDLVADINRRVLSQAPASAVQMLEYKALEAGIPCVIHDVQTHVAVGRDIAATVKAGRKARRKCKE